MGVGSIQILGGSQPVAYLETGGHIDGHKKFDDLFWEANICRPFFRRTTNLATFFLLTFSHSHPSPLDPSERGAIRPSTCLQVLQKIFPSAKGGPWHNGPPKYATVPSPFPLPPPLTLHPHPSPR
jgi:hypothetical protein